MPNKVLNLLGRSKTSLLLEKGFYKEFLQSFFAAGNTSRDRNETVVWVAGDTLTENIVNRDIYCLDSGLSCVKMIRHHF